MIETNGCKHLEDVLKAEMPAIKIAYLHRQVLLSEEMGTPISYKTAERDFNNKYMMSFVEGWKLCFCYYVCKDKDICEIKESEAEYLKTLKKIL